MSDLHLSIIVPAFNESENLERLVAEVTEVVAPVGQAWELVIVDDGSTDGSPEIFRRLLAAYPHLRVIALQKRSGQTAALEAGLRAARGEILATLDADLQNDPRDIVRLLPLVAGGPWDMVNGWRRNRRDPWLRRVSTKVANGVRNRLTHENINDSACALKVFRRECVERLKFFNGLHRFLPTLIKMEGYRVTELEVNHRPRVAGTAKYGLWNRVFRALRDAFAIRWMQSRMIRCQARELERDGHE